MANDPLVRLSKRLSLVLRHDPDSIGIILDAAGWTPVASLISALKIQREVLTEVVETNNKKRFEFSEDGKQIRASQGHSVDVDLGYEEKIPPDHLYHGTSWKFMEAIMRDGLKPMSRHDVHLSDDKATAMIVAKRRPSPVVLKVNSLRMAGLGHKFRLSTNGVWLTTCVGPEFIQVAG